MILAIVFAQVWGVIQLIILTSMARTVRVRTVFAAMAVGFYAIGPITAFIQLSWIRIAVMLFGKSLADMTGVASYTVDPFIEEAMKLLPLAMLMLIPAIRRQWSVSDCVLIAAATGSGFGLTEHLFRYANNPHNAQGVSGGWVLTIGNHEVLVPGFFHTLTSWLPNGAFFYSDPIIINWHLAWSAIGGLAVGLLARRRDRNALLIAAGLFLLIGLMHAAGNTTDIHESWLALLAGPLTFLTSGLGILAFTAVVAAWWLDQPSQRVGRALGPLLPAEESATSPFVGTFTVALSRLPWSIPWVYGFDRARRACQSARVATPDGHDDMREAMIAQRDLVERKLKEAEAPALLPSWLTSGNLRTELRNALRRPPVIIWLVLIAPSVLYLIVGGFPQTAGLQRVLISPGVWQLVLLITVINLARVAWRVTIGFRRLPATTRLPIGDDAAMLGLQLACGVGAVSLGGFTLLRVLSGVSAGQMLLSHAHAADAANRVTPGSGMAVAGSAGAADPPPPSPKLPGDAAADAAAAGAAGGGAGSNGGGAGSNGDAPASPGGGSDSGYSPLPDPVIPVNNLPDAPPADPYEYSPLPDPVIPVNNLPDAPPADPNEYSPLPDPVIPVNKLPDAPPADPSGYSPLPDPVIPVNDLPDAPAAEAPPDAGTTANAPSPSNPDEDGVGTRVPDDATPANSKSAPPTPQPTPQEQADDALARSEQADNDAVAAQQAKTDAVGAADAAEIKAATKDPASDPDVAAAQARTRAAQTASERADNAAADGDDPWDPNASNKSAADAFQREAKEAKAAQDAAESDFNNRQAADPDVAAAKAAASQAQDAQNAADAQAAAAHQNAVNAHANADAAAAKAASDAARAANPAQAAADDAAKAVADAQAKENDAFFGKDAKAYHDARAALDAARQKAADAQAAADAARDRGSSSDHTRAKKP